jgi:hypothetical protein
MSVQHEQKLQNHYFIIIILLKLLFCAYSKLSSLFLQHKIQWKPLIMITLGPVLFDNNNRLITLSGGYKYLHYLNQFIVTNFTCIKNNKIYLKN